MTSKWENSIGWPQKWSLWPSYLYSMTFIEDRSTLWTLLQNVLYDLNLTLYSSEYPMISTECTLWPQLNVIYDLCWMYSVTSTKYTLTTECTLWQTNVLCDPNSMYSVTLAPHLRNMNLSLFLSNSRDSFLALALDTRDTSTWNNINPSQMYSIWPH